MNSYPYRALAPRLGLRLAPLLALSLATTLAACAGSSKPAGPAPVVVQPPPPSADGSPATTAPKVTKSGPNVTPEGVVFNYKAEVKVGRIILAGNFNDWKPDNTDYQLKDDDGDGIYSITVKLPPGEYQYKYVIDSKWTQDPYGPAEAPDGFGGMNSKFEVK